MLEKYKTSFERIYVIFQHFSSYICKIKIPKCNKEDLIPRKKKNSQKKKNFSKKNNKSTFYIQ